MVEKNKIRCKECEWEGIQDQVLTAKHPFHQQDVLYGCPGCGEVDWPFDTLCDEAGCKKEVTCGTPTSEGYRTTCSEHKPKEGCRVCQ